MFKPFTVADIDIASTLHLLVVVGPSAGGGQQLFVVDVVGWRQLTATHFFMFAGPSPKNWHSQKIESNPGKIKREKILCYDLLECYVAMHAGKRGKCNRNLIKTLILLCVAHSAGCRPAVGRRARHIINNFDILFRFAELHKYLEQLSTHMVF